MKTSWMIGMVMIFVACTVLDGIPAGTYFGGGAGTIWTAVSSFKTIEIANPVSLAFGLALAVWEMIVGIFQILTWNYPNIFVGAWAIVRWVLFGITVGMVVSLLLALRGTSSA